MKPKARSCSGIGLIGLISAMVVMMLLGAGIIMLVTTGVMEEVGGRNRSGAFFAAETGVSRAKYAIFTNASWYANTNAPYMILTGMIGRASFYAVVTTNNPLAPIITSTGTLEEAHWTSIWKGSGSVAVAVAQAMLVYATCTNVCPRYRIWGGTGGTNWSGPSNAVSVGSTGINWVVVKACPKRDEYIAATIDTNKVVMAQVYTNGTWGNLKTIATNSATYRGMDIAYETLSGDAMVVGAATTNLIYYIWNGSAWTGPGNTGISTNGNVMWVKLAADPVSDEIIVLVQNTNTFYTAQVWNGSAWGNPQRPVAKSSGVAYECMAVEYETSGNQAIIVSGNGATANTTTGAKWSSWNGTNWSAEGTITNGDHLEQGILVNDPNSDKLLLTYIDHDINIGKLFWSGSAWTTFFELETAGYAIADRPVQGQFETISGHAGHALIPYSDTAIAAWRHATDPSGATWSTEASVTNIVKSATVQTRRTGDGNILALFFETTNIRYDFSWFNGTGWSARQTLEPKPSVKVTPFKEPFMMAPKIFVNP